MSRRPRTRAFTGDSFQNFIAQVGIGTGNVASGGTYGFNPISRNRVLIEWAYRGSWIVRKTVDCPAEDMTRQGTTILDDMSPDKIDEIALFWRRKKIWQRFTQALKWARLYGGALAFFVIEGQDPEKPLRMKTVGRGQFKGIVVLDRWMVQPDYNDLVTDPGEDYGTPKFYDVVDDARTLPTMRVHHSRVARFDGIELPYWQRLAENGWGLSVLEPLWDRLLAYDSATQGAAQLVYKAYLRTLKMPKLREAIAAGGKQYGNIVKMVNAIRMFQASEGITLLDADDTFETSQYAFSGLSDMMIQFGTQLSGSADVPLTRMFGQSPGGLNSSGDSDLRNYYDGLKSRQEGELSEPVHVAYELTYRSLYGEDLPDAFGFTFNPLWQLTEGDKTNIAAQVASAVTGLAEAQIITPVIAAKELRQVSRLTGVFTNVTDEFIAEVEANPPAPEGEEPPDGLGGGGEGGFGGGPDGGAPDGPEGAESEPPGEGVPSYAGPDEALGAGVGEGAVGGPIDGEAIARARALQPPTRTPRAKVAAAAWKLGRARDRRTVIEVGPLTVVVETQKGARRIGPGWAVTMPADYGYISGTSSAEGPREQTDAFVGPDPSAPTGWVIEQKDPATGLFDEHKVMLGFPTKAAALDAYVGAFSDGRGRERIGRVREVSVAKIAEWLSRWRYGSLPDNVKGRRA